MLRTLSTSSFKQSPFAFFLCLSLLICTEAVVRTCTTNLMTVSERIVAERIKALKSGALADVDMLIMGDSRALGLDAKFLEDRLATRDRRSIRVENFAIPNHGIRAYHLLLEELVSRQVVPRYIIFSSGPIGITGKWSIENIDRDQASRHYLVRIFPLWKLVRAVPMRQAYLMIETRIENFSKLVLYRKQIRQRIRNPRTFLQDRNAKLPELLAKAHGGIIISAGGVVHSNKVRQTMFYSTELVADQEAISAYEKFFRLAQSHDIQILLLNMPIVDMIDKHRAVMNRHSNYIQTVQKWVHQFDHIKIIPPLIMSYEMKYFGDAHHLNPEGLRKFNLELAERLFAFMDTL